MSIDETTQVLISDTYITIFYLVECKYRSNVFSFTDVAFGFGTPIGSFGFGGLLSNFVGNVCCGWARAIKLIVLEERTE
jgi:hypothetical protein